MEKQAAKRHYLLRKLKYEKIFATSLGGALAIALLAFLSHDQSFLIPPFGASCVIALVIPDSAYAKARSIVGGHFLASLVGLMVFSLGGGAWWCYGLAVGLAMLVMQLTRTLHPPAAADPVLILEQGPLDWSFLIFPILVGTMILVLFAASYRRYFLPQRTKERNKQVFLTNEGNKSKINKV